MRDQSIVASVSDSRAAEAQSNTESTPTPTDLYLKKIAQKHERTKSVATLPLVVEETAKRYAEEPLAEPAKKKKTVPEMCPKSELFTAKHDFKTHQGSCKKKPVAEVSVFEWNESDKVAACEVTLDEHYESQYDNVVIPNKVRHKKYKCDLCKETTTALYKHYGIRHEIEKIEQILFVNGRVLVFSDINTENGDALWFKEQLEKAKTRYKGYVCRLCDVDLESAGLLRPHYIEHHKVDADSLDRVELMFRSEIGAHLHHSPETTRADKKRRKGGTCIIFRCKCGDATDRYDVAVEHSQEHLVAKHTGKEMSVTWKAAFVTDIDDNREFKVIDYDFEALLTEKWLDMFMDSSDKKKILSSSLYWFSRGAKFYLEGSDSRDGIAVYKCAMCQVIFEPKMIENHCENDHNCANKKPKGNYCKKCKARFYSVNALASHRQKHAAGIRLVTFNHKSDARLNKVLRELQNSSKDSQEEDIVIEIGGHTKKLAETKPIEIKDVELYCKLCQKWMDASIIEAHTAAHQKEK